MYDPINLRSEPGNKSAKADLARNIGVVYPLANDGLHDRSKRNYPPSGSGSGGNNIARQPEVDSLIQLGLGVRSYDSSSDKDDAGGRHRSFYEPRDLVFSTLSTPITINRPINGNSIQRFEQGAPKPTPGSKD
jgi:hypothetical protein